MNLKPGQRCSWSEFNCQAYQGGSHEWLGNDGTDMGYWNTVTEKERCKYVEPQGLSTEDQQPTGYRAAAWLRNVADNLEKKSISYGDSVGKPLRIFSQAGTTEGIRVRIDDKLSRVARGKEWPGDDVVIDLVGYLALLAVTEANMEANNKANNETK